MLRITQFDPCEDNLLNLAGETYLCFVGDKLPESTGEMIQLSWGNFWTRLGKWLHWGVCIPPGNNLIFLLRNIKNAGDA